MLNSSIPNDESLINCSINNCNRLAVRKSNIQVFNIIHNCGLHSSIKIISIEINDDDDGGGSRFQRFDKIKNLSNK
ncbi:hypothetical protein DERP_006329 [Dermatophagoides pteronyssinus]|uniref:Uncharacterized protein n=1 Tax=Dermatophagoides pteronyssinus TaxID=6956 RepID=A0ABQ8IY44_DERPT|nr:hypothetical protein DERP_006329 [Dermatophagoides pteronyssinus]